MICKNKMKDFAPRQAPRFRERSAPCFIGPLPTPPGPLQCKHCLGKNRKSKKSMFLHFFIVYVVDCSFQCVLWLRRATPNSCFLSQTWQDSIWWGVSEWSNHEGGIMKEESCRRNHAGGIMEEESWRRNHLGGIWSHLGDIWRHLEASGGIWEASGGIWE